MKNITAAFAFLVIAVFVLGGIFGSSALAAKPLQVIQWSNGFPSGEHYNLNIHGKNADYICDSNSGGNSVFVPEYGNSSIQLIQNRKSSVSNLTVIDSCSFESDDPAKVQLPSGEYQVYARILAKPGKQKDEEIRSVLFYPRLFDACNDNTTAPIEGFGNYTDCSNSSLAGLGIITQNGAFSTDLQSLERTAPVKGKNKATDITGMFQWTGWACNESVDTDGDGNITIHDTGDMNSDGMVNQTDLDLYLSQNCQYMENRWIFDLADMVVYGWDYNNYGSKLVQVRFYPLKTTEFI